VGLNILRVTGTVKDLKDVEQFGFLSTSKPTLGLHTRTAEGRCHWKALALNDGRSADAILEEVIEVVKKPPTAGKAGGK
jgi:hypothetical protein